MKRRNFLKATTLAGFGFTFPQALSANNQKATKEIRDTFSLTGNKASIYTNSNIKTTRIFHITDTHLSLDDERGDAFKEFSKRMAGAYKSNEQFETGEQVTTIQSFEQTLQRAKDEEADFLALTGDIFSFPSEAAIDWVGKKLEETGIPYGYIAGNHDWHYEGMKGSSNNLRKTWTEKRLNSLYKKNNPLFASYEFNGLQLVFIDDSTYEIEPEQLVFLKEQIKTDKPFLLFLHIPLYIPGRSMGYGCANPEWGAESDKNYELERREQWGKGGHTETTFHFYDEVFNAQNLLGIFAGHTHQPAIDLKNNIPQVVSGHNATGYFTHIEINPA
ncbi:metallophosphoesterase family protein [Maribellus maritimus]|uniref:metallophosphoesterase family protein n=1 Tax=Maribellus maritimus TaxID=2870838 RepID=UPI001EECCB3F|nr:metallophosphoesterase [Maribellus maritimus]MCG6189226.1 metallophosphoesterase [Maribellus maritimus]